MEWGPRGWGIGILFVICVLGEINTKAAETPTTVTKKTVADSLYQTAINMRDQAPLKESLDAFKKVLKSDPQYALAHYHLAKLYAKSNTVNDRQRAKRSIEKATQIAPSNTEFRLAFGDILWQQEFWNEAEAQYQKAFQLDTLNATIAFQLGKRALDAYFKHKDLKHLDIISAIDPRVGPIYNRVTWTAFGNQDLERAIAFLEHAIQIDPTYRHAYYRLGLAHYESNRPDQLVLVSSRLLKHLPGDKNALLFMALGFQAVNRLDQAHKLFTAAINRLNPDERAILESLDLVASLEIRQQIQQTESTFTHQNKTWVDSDTRALFWHKQDPLYLTDYNERRMAHYGRVAYTNLRYGRPEHNISGWQTDQGMAYIKYGRPLNRRIKRADDRFKIAVDEPLSQVETRATRAFGNAHTPMESLFSNIGNRSEAQKKTNFQTEVWTYENFKLEFIAADGRNGRLASSTPKQSRYVDPYKNHKYTTPHQILAFKETGGVRLEIAYALPSNRFQSQTATVDDGLFIFDPTGQEIDKQIHQSTIQWPKPKTHWDRYHILTREIHLSLGNYNILVEARDKQTGAIATFREPQTFVAHKTTLAMSDLFLARRIQEEKPFPEVRSDLSILPNPRRTYNPTDPVYVYLEVYNLIQNEFGRTRFDITYHISAPNKAEIDPALFMDQNIARQITIETFLSETQPQRTRENATDNTDGVSGSAPSPTAHSSHATIESRVKYVLPKSRKTDQLKRATQDGVEMATSVTAEYEGDRTDDFTYLQFDVSQLPTGIHKLTVTIRDRFSNTQTQRHTLFRVMK